MASKWTISDVRNCRVPPSFASNYLTFTPGLLHNFLNAQVRGTSSTPVIRAELGSGFSLLIGCAESWMTHVGQTLLSSCRFGSLRVVGWCNLECEWANEQGARCRVSFKGVGIANTKADWNTDTKERGSWQFSKTLSTRWIEIWEGGTWFSLSLGLFLPAGLHNLLTWYWAWWHYIHEGFWSWLPLEKVHFFLPHMVVRGQRLAAGVQCPAEDPINMGGCLPTQLLDHFVHHVEHLQLVIAVAHWGSRCFVTLKNIIKQGRSDHASLIDE